MEKINLVTAKGKDLKELLKMLITEEVFYNSDGILIGYVENIEVIDRQNKDKQKYEQIQFNVKSHDGKSFSKRYSVDFTRKYFNQLACKAADIIGSTVVFKPTGKYKQIGWWAYVSEKDDKFSINPYVDEGEDFAERLSKLGL